MKKIKAVYLRKSRESKGEDTFETMRSRLIRMCEQNNWEYELYEDIIEGDKYKEELQRLLSNIEKYDAIVTDAVDRIGRDEQENAEVKKTLWLNDVQVITLNKTYDFENESDEMMFGLESLFAKWEHKQIKRRLKNGKVDRFRNGLYTTGKPPLGYRNTPSKTLEIYEPEAEIVRYIFELSAQGIGSKVISDRLNERGYRVQTGRAFPISRIQAIQKNKIYIGTTSMDVYNKRGQIVETITNENSCPPIVSVPTFLQANDELKRRYLNKNHTRSYVKSCLSGLIKCERCGIRLTIAVEQRSAEKITMLRGCPTCNSRGVPVRHIEEVLIADLQSLIIKLKKLASELSSMDLQSIKDEVSKEITVYNERIKVLDKDEDRLTDLALDGLISKEKLKQRKATIDQEMSQLKLRLTEAHSRLLESPSSKIEHIEKQIEFIANFSDNTMDTQNEFLKYSINSITYWRDNTGRGKKKTALDDYPPIVKTNFR